MKHLHFNRLTWGGIIGILALLIGVMVTYLTISRPFPQTTGTHMFVGLDAPVAIRRNAEGVPHITAATAHDLAFAQGVVHAQDRLFEMDVQRRMAQGTLQNLIPDANSLAELPPLPRSSDIDPMILAAYSDGVNQYVAQAAALPLEYQWLNAAWQPWRGEDSLAVLALYQAEAERTTPFHRGWENGTSRATVIMSENSDLPIAWYASQLETPERHALGVSLAGVPEIVLGQANGGAVNTLIPSLPFIPTTDDVTTYLTNTTDPAAPRWVATLNASPSDDLIVQRAQEQLAQWNGEMRPDLPGAMLYRVVRAFTLREMLTDELGQEEATTYLTYSDGQLLEALVEQPTHPLWDDKRTPTIETRDAIIGRAWEEAHHYLGRRFGDVPHEWTWGRLHYITLRHPLAAQTPLFDRLLTRILPLAGSPTTAIPSQDDLARDFAPTYFPSLFIVMETGGEVAIAYPGGQSAFPLHPHRDSFLEAWQTRTPQPLQWNAAPEDVLNLEPN